MSEGDQDYRSPEHCLPEIHRWKPIEIIDGQLPVNQMIGRQCYCGMRVLILHACECGNEHLRQVQVGSVKIEKGT